MAPRGKRQKTGEDAGKIRVLILGAAGRDFHNFNCYFRDNEKYEVVAFTAIQIPKIAGRKYPPVLAGKLYPNGIEILEEADMEKIITERKVDLVMLAYSDLPHTWVMQRACRALALGCNFELMGWKDTQVKSCKPVIAVTAVRTGSGKSQTTGYITNVLKAMGKKAVVVRHPMPYGDLAEMIVQRFEKYEDCEKHKVTVEEREEYEQHIKNGIIVYAGVDYEKILRQAEKEADVVIWDGGNNDMPFYTPDLWFCVADPHRQGHEISYYPGDVNFRGCDVIVINKCNTAPEGSVAAIEENARKVNPKAKIVKTISEVMCDHPELVKGKRVVCVDDGPTLTHGEMRYGAGQVCAQKYGAAEIIDPKPWTKGTMRALYNTYPHIGKLIPAMGYFPEQLKDLEDTINAVECDCLILATPMDLSTLIHITKPYVVATYHSEDMPGLTIRELVEKFVKEHKA